MPREFAVAEDIPSDPVEVENDSPPRDDSETPPIPASKVLESESERERAREGARERERKRERAREA